MVEIRELVIKTTISDQKAAGNEDRTAGKKDQDLIKSCVEEVLKVLKREKER